MRSSHSAAHARSKATVPWIVVAALIAGAVVLGFALNVTLWMRQAHPEERGAEIH